MDSTAFIALLNRARKSVILCEHANEVPRGACSCTAECPCRDSMCKAAGVEAQPTPTVYDLLG